MVTQEKQNNTQPAFRNSFWNGDIGNFQGFEILVKRMKDDRTVCKEYAEFLRQRSLIEEQYGKALVKLAKSGCCRDEMSCIRGSWEAVRTHTETIGMNHVQMLQASSQLAAEVSKVTDFLEATREKKKWSEETVRSLQTQLRTAHKRMLEVKKAYESRAREEIQANQLYHQEVSRSGRDSSVAERAHSRHAKIVSGLEQSEELYRQAVEAVEEVRLSWLAETETCAGLFEDLSTSRLKVLRDSAWLSSNIGSAACVLDDSVYEESRQVLETAYSDLGGVLQDWVRTERTGEESPGPVICQWAATSSSLGVSGHLRSLRAGQQLSYDTASLGRTEASQSWPHLADLGRSRSDLGQAVPLQPLKQQQTTPAVLRSPKKPPRMFQYKNNNNNSISSVSSKKSLRSLNVPISVENGEYHGGGGGGGGGGVSSSDYNSDVSLSDHSPRARPASRQALVTCQYKRKHYSEISLDVNTLVTVLEAAPNNNWWRVKTDHGMAGFYPANYLRHI